MSNSQQDVRHRLVGNAIWALPVGQGGMLLNQDNMMGRLIGHWQLNAIASFQTGIPFDVTAPDESFTGGNHMSYPDCSGDPFAGASSDPKNFVGSNSPGFFINPAAIHHACAGLLRQLPSTHVSRPRQRRCRSQRLQKLPYQRPLAL